MTLNLKTQIRPERQILVIFVMPVILNRKSSVVLSNNQFFSVSVTWTGSTGATGVQNFIFPFGTSAGVGVNSITSPFEGDTT